MLEAFVVSIVVVANSLLAFFVLYSSRKSFVRRLFGATILLIIMWMITNFLADYYAYIRPSEAVTTLFTRITLLFGLLITIDFYFFTEQFPRGRPHSWTSSRIIWVIFYCALSVLSATPITVQSVELSSGVEIKYGVFYLVYVIAFVGLLSASFVNLVRSFRISSGIARLQIQYVLIGTALLAAFASFTNLLAPLLFSNTSASRYGPYFTVFLVVFTSYAIVKHRLLDIRLIITRSIVYGLLLVLVSFGFVLTTLASAQFFGETILSRALLTGGVASLIVFGLEPLRHRLSTATDRIFFKAQIDYALLLKRISETLNYELDLTRLIVDVRKRLQEELKLKNAAILLRRNGPNGLAEKFVALPDLLSSNPNLSLNKDSPLVRFLREKNHISFLEALERKIEDESDTKRADLISSKEDLERLGAAAAVPIFAQGHLVAILVLGPKLSGDSFTNEDSQFIEVISPQIGSAIQKASLFQEVKEFSAGLQEKVDAATRELRERNTSLQTLQRVTREITKTLDFNRVVQQIADAVALELGYMGAVLVFLDEDGVTVRARAITDTPLTRIATKLLPRHFSEFTTRLDGASDENMAHYVLRNGEVMMTGSLAQVISPPVPKLIANQIQKVMQVKTVVLVPVISETRVIGCIEIGVQKPQEQISKAEIQTMQSLADELGVVVRNLSLFSAIQRTNRQLEDANKHLQQLDQAKSEFVSIASHQLRTPMTGIMGYLSMLTDGDFGKMAPEHVEILRNLLDESKRMIRLINQFLNVSKIEAGKFTYAKQPVRLDELVGKRVAELQKTATDKGLKLILEPPALPFPATLADADKLDDVILNLIDNAIKYTSSGSVTVRISATDRDIHCAVTDTGIGIKPSDASELFNKFVRGSGIAQIHPDGSGLGLFIAKSIIDAHAGRIWAESAGPGKGSTFQFQIPIVPVDNDLGKK